MEPGARAELEAAVRDRCAAGDVDEATTRALRLYGREVFGFQCALAKSESDASEAFSIFAEELWRSLGRFAWESTLRTWVYTLARRAVSRDLRRKRRDRLLVGAPIAVSEIAGAVRTETLTYLRTETKSRVRALRDALAEDDRALLVLRVDRGLGWDELARVMHDDDLDADAQKREVARLRKRFQLVKERLRAMAKEQGLGTDSR
jgi:RNA polymerase sigma-70 factor (ECF subfamily)